MHLDPPPGGWGATPVRQESPVARASREALGIDPIRPVIASGHQPVVFHMGITAKLIALDAWARLYDAATLWVVPDMDVVDPSVVRVPVSSGDDLRAESRTLGTPSGLEGPVMSMPPASAGRDTVFSRLVSSLDAHADEPTRARQFAHAVIGDLCGVLGITPPTIVFASDLLNSPAGTRILDTMLEDPAACVRAYNDAIERCDDAGVKPLAIDSGRIELPLWRIRGDQRERVFSDTAATGTEGLVPRGLAMTAIVRAALCDAFIHGTGGMKYDRVTERWIDAWLGDTLTPIAGVSATATLDLPLPESYKDPDKAIWEAHHARHDPEMLDEDAAAERKAELVRAIDERKSRGEDTSSLFDELQSLLTHTRREHAGDLERYDEQAEEAQRFRDMHAVANDRTWAYPLFPEAAILDLRDAVVAGIGS